MWPRLASVVVLAGAGVILTVAPSGCGNDDTALPASALLDGGSTGSDAPNGGDAFTAPPAKIEGLLEPLRAGSGVPGIAALVLRGGTVVAEGAVGVRKLGDPTPLTTDDSWFLGTDAQTMTATLAARVVQDGKITWASTLGSVLADVPMHASYTNVTLEALLGHRGGAPVKVPDAVAQQMRLPGTAQARREEAVRALLAAPAEGTPGDVHRADAGYLMAAVMLERAAGSAWETQLRARVLDPLGMTGCSYDPRGAAGTVVEPWGHVANADVLAAVAPGSVLEAPPAMGPAGRVRCPLRDWSKLAALHLAGARGEKTAFLTTPYFTALQTPVAMTEALGWNAVSRPWAGEQLALVRESENPLFVAAMWVAPARNVAFVVVANESDSIALAAVDQVVGKLIEGFALP